MIINIMIIMADTGKWHISQTASHHKEQQGEKMMINLGNVDSNADADITMMINLGNMMLILVMILVEMMILMLENLIPDTHLPHFSRWKVSAKIQQLLNTLKKPKRRPLPEFYEDDDKVILNSPQQRSHCFLEFSLSLESHSLPQGA